ncbi:50S ribosome-binding GTPase [Halobaculum sp. CBA1158]|uniref:HflX GTPase family protein n=1 Tax=Halobaculum sp. CBA1158 TaxID=2904243 RepID=UPI001F25D805|nr:GTPase [Halobaculum sp. CBA1158]UIO99037.1 50S ribosome-binding GTPase [Halobaculum sp. CBA1158]
MNVRDRLTGGSAVVAARDAESTPDTTEIRRLATAAGYEVVGEVTQRREEDRRYHLGAGKARDLATTVAEAGADAVVVDGDLTPGQYTDLLEVLPPETALVDRYRLVLEIFAEGAGSPAATTQVRLATLRYELPRVRRATEESLLNAATEKGSPVLDVQRRIDGLENRLAELTDAAADRRERRREEGFDLVAVAGYTNAGKSTLLRRLADDLDVERSVDDGERPAGDGHGEHDGRDGNAGRDEHDGRDEHGLGGGDHDDVPETATTADRLFETLETTTRRATIGGRRVLVTDTVGLVADLPHDLVRSFSATLDEIAASDAVLAVVDASAAEDRLRRRVETTVGVLAGDATGPVIPVLAKADRLDDAERETAATVVADALGGVDVETRDPVAVSALDGEGVDDLRSAVCEALPSATARLDLPNTGETQALVSWLHDRGDATVRYEGDAVAVRFAGKPAVVAEARRRADDIGGDATGSTGPPE